MLVTASSGQPKTKGARVGEASFAIGLLLIAFACGGGTKQSTPQSPGPSAVKFASRVDISTGGNMDTGGFHSGSLALADFNGDGLLDIAVSNFASNSIAVFLNTGSGVFGSPILTSVQIPNGLGAIVTCDFNEDGKPDLIAATISGPQIDLVLLGNGDGTFTQSVPIPNSFGFLQGRVLDLNGDNHLDLVGGGNGNMSVALGNGDGTFAPVTYLGNGPAPGTYFGVDVGDLNGDGKADIVGVNYGYGTGDIVVFFGNGDGTFQSPISQTALSSGPDSVFAADFNGDGKLDLLIGYGPSNVLLFSGNGDGTFNSNPLGVYSTIPPQGSGSSVRAADLNRDGRPDALVADYTGGVFTIVLSNGGAIPNPSTRSSFTIAPGLSDIATGDLNGDGKPDVVLVNSQTNQISLFLSQ